MMTQQGGPAATGSTKGQYAPVNGINLYYEIHGGGTRTPLVLLHGGLGLTEMLGPILPALAASRRVIAVDLQAHGRTADIARPLGFESSADDIAALIKHLGLAEADVMGYSFGGGAALQTAIRHPDVLRRLVLVSTPFKRDGWYPDVVMGQAALGPAAAEMMKPSPLYQAYARVAPKPENWPVLLTKMGQLLGQDYDWSAGVAGIRAPVLLVFADADAIPPSHAVEFFGLLGGGKGDPGWDGAGGRPASRLAILPGQTHYDIFAAPALVSVVTPFLDAV